MQILQGKTENQWTYLGGTTCDHHLAMIYVLSSLFSEHLTIHHSILKFLMSPCWPMRSHTSKEHGAAHGTATQAGPRRRDSGTHMDYLFIYLFRGPRSIHTGQAEAPKAGRGTSRAQWVEYKTQFVRRPPNHIPLKVFLRKKFYLPP